MKRRWLMTVLSFNVLSLSAQISAASPAFPNIPSIDDPRLIVQGFSYDLADDDIKEDEPALPIKMTHMRVRSDIALRYARTAIICNVYNPSKRPQEATFNVLLPDTAFISGFTMTLGKETYEAYVKEKEVAKQLYKDAVAQGVSAAHVATTARDSNHFTIKFNVEGRTNATYRLRYEELLVRRNGVYNHAINLHPGSLVPKMDVVIHIKESQKISVLRVPEIRTGNEIDATDKDAQNANAVIRRGKNEREATISFNPDLAQQRRLAEIYATKIKTLGDPDFSDIGYDSTEAVNESEGILGQFVVQYDVDQPKNGEVLVNDGYFVHFFAPSSLPPLNKHAVFVLDTSSSMIGNKIEQLQKAMAAILSDLRPNDYFSLIEFNTYVKVRDLQEAHKPIQSTNHKSSVNLLPPALASHENIALAKIIVSRLHATGGTNVFQALDVALNVTHLETQIPNESLVKYNNGTNPNKNDLEPIIIFLSDGDPTIGLLNTDRIISYMTEKNTGSRRAPIYSLAFGEDANRDFLRKLSLRNDGFMRHIYEASDAALQLHDFYRQVSSPLLADVKFQYPRRQIKEGSLSRSQFRTINEGSEVAVVGRTAENVYDISPRVLALRAENANGLGRKTYEANPKVTITGDKDEFLPLERLWAYLTIQQLLDKKDAGDVSNSGLKDESSEKEALAIALKYSFVTPLTSLVVVRLNKTDDNDIVDAERVDEPKHIVCRHAPVPSAASLRKLTYKGLSTDPKIETTGTPDNTSAVAPAMPTTGETLSVASDDGPVLFAQLMKRFTTYDIVDPQQQTGVTRKRRPRPHSNQGQVTRLPPLMNFNTHALDFEDYSIGGPIFDIPNFTTTSTTAATPNNTRIESVYHVEEFEWVLGLLNASEDALVWTNYSGSQVILKLSRDVVPPANPGGDYECWPGEVEGVLCVYLTRCHAARSYSALQYQHNYCQAGDGYAGVCCAKSEIDKKF